jgi:predicted DCC family thiol-disulfide oxidoreductase YuxK
MCVAAKNGLEQLRGKDHAEEVRLIAYQSEEAKEVLGSLYRSGRPDAAFLVSSDRTIATGLDAFLPLLPGLKGGQLLASFLSLPLVKPFAHLAYRVLARYRYRLFGEVPFKRPE